MAQFDDALGASEEAATGELTLWRFHMADAGTETYEREQTFSSRVVRAGCSGTSWVSR